MTYKRLFVLVEGDDDERLIRWVAGLVFKGRYDSVEIWKYARAPGRKLVALVRSINAMGADYILLTDLNKAPCVTARKQQMLERCREIDGRRIVVVVREVECWYLAGLDEDACKRKLHIPRVDVTDSMNKEQFDNLMPSAFASRVDFMREVLKLFSVKIATRKNGSFRYLVEKFGAIGDE